MSLVRRFCAPAPSRFVSGCLAALLLTIPMSNTAAADSIQDNFDRAVELLRGGNNAEALDMLRQVLAEDPSNERAYDLWLSTEERVWVDMLVEEGEIALIAQRLMSLAEMRVETRRNDEDAIRGLLDEIYSGDSGARRKAIVTLSAQHGEYAVPYMLPALADEVDDDRRVNAMQALTVMSERVVLPLIEALDSSNAYQRRQICFTLGHIGDRRAHGMLAWVASSDPDGSVQDAARFGLEKLGGSASQDAARAAFLAAGDAYRARAESVLGPDMASSVVWSWSGGALESREVPGWLYAEEMAAKSYYRALAAGAEDAAAGIASARAAQLSAQMSREWAGLDGDDSIQAGMLEIVASGPAALTSALSRALASQDDAAAWGLCYAMGACATKPSDALKRALDARAPVSGQAALALGKIALRTGKAASAATAAELAESAGREVNKIVGLSDSDATRSAALISALEARGAHVALWSSGAEALVAMRRAPGFDLFIIADDQVNLTAHQVLSEIRNDPRFEETPILVASSSEDAEDLYGEMATAILTGGDDMGSSLDDALAGELTGERARAASQAADSAAMLGELASAGRTDLSAALSGLGSAVETRSDEVAIPLMSAMGRAGVPALMTNIAAVLSDDSRSEAARSAAAIALGDYFGRGNTGSEEVLESLRSAALDSDSFDLRLAASRALGLVGDGNSLLRNLREQG